MRNRPGGRSSAYVRRAPAIALAVLLFGLLHELDNRLGARPAAPAKKSSPSSVSPRQEMPATRKLLWLDCSSDTMGLASRDQIARVLDKTREAGFNIVVPDARLGSAIPFCNSGTTTQTASLRDGVRAGSFDPLSIVVEEAHRRGMKVHAGLWVFAEDTSDCDSEASITTETVKGRGNKSGPENLETQERSLALIDQLLTSYDIDGVLLCHVRSQSSRLVLGEQTRARFEKEIGSRVARWPEDICTPGDSLTSEPMRRGPHFTAWVLWRAGATRDFIRQAREVVRRHRGRILGNYVDGDYGTCWATGSNWASAKYDATNEFGWAPPGFGRTACLELLDYLSPAVSFPTVMGTDAPDPVHTVEGAIALAQRVTRDDAPLAPALVATDFESEEAYEAAIRLCLEMTGGVMIISHTYIEKMNRWEATMRGLEATRKFLE